jgi:hypothetical protein
VPNGKTASGEAVMSVLKYANITRSSYALEAAGRNRIGKLGRQRKWRIAGKQASQNN